MYEIHDDWHDLFGIRLKRIMSIFGYSVKEFAQQIHSDIGLSVESAETYISNARSGNVQYHESNTRSKPEFHRRRMAKFLSALGVDEDDEIVNIVREIDSGFEYPPGGEEHATELDNMPLDDKLSRLKPQDLKLLEIAVNKILDSYSEI